MESVARETMGQILIEEEFHKIKQEREALWNLVSCLALALARTSTTASICNNGTGSARTILSEFLERTAMDTDEVLEVMKASHPVIESVLQQYRDTLMPQIEDDDEEYEEDIADGVDNFDMEM